MFIKIFNLEKNRELLELYRSSFMWRTCKNSNIFGRPELFSFKSRFKFAIKNLDWFIPNLWTGRKEIFELFKVWCLDRQSGTKRGRKARKKIFYGQLLMYKMI